MSRIIHVTHFVNPYCFYFKFDDDLHDDMLQDLEIEISNCARRKIGKNAQFKPVDGDIVAAFVTSWSKWVRAQLRANLVDFERYELWAIDHGKMFETEYNNVVPLPDELIQRNVKGVSQGCIHGIHPARLELNMETYRSELRACSDWSAKALAQCNDLINNNSILKICFDIDEQRDNHHFGQLFIETFDKRRNSLHKIDFGQVLIEIDEGIEVNPVEFRKDMHHIVEKYDTFHKALKLNSESVVMNGNSIRRKLMAMSAKNQGQSQNQSQNSVSNESPSRAASTVIASEINDGMTRMNITNRLKNPAPSIVPSTIVPSEIDGGKTRMQMNRKQNQHRTTNGNDQMNRNGTSHMPAGYERDIPNFNKYNNQRMISGRKNNA